MLFHQLHTWHKNKQERGQLCSRLRMCVCMSACSRQPGVGFTAVFRNLSLWGFISLTLWQSGRQISKRCDVRCRRLCEESLMPNRYGKSTSKNPTRLVIIWAPNEPRYNCSRYVPKSQNPCYIFINKLTLQLNGWAEPHGSQGQNNLKYDEGTEKLVQARWVAPQIGLVGQKAESGV